MFYALRLSCSNISKGAALPPALMLMLTDAVLPVGILRTDVHLQQDPLGEGFEALATLPQVPVAELAAQLAGGGRARQDPLVLRPQLAESRVRLGPDPDLVQQGEAPRARGVGEDHGSHEGGGGGGRGGGGRRGRGFAVLAEGLQGLLPGHGLHHRGRDVYWRQKAKGKETIWLKMYFVASRERLSR